MSIENQSSYKITKKWLDNLIESKINGVVVTFPGCGLSRRLDKYVELHSGVKIITREGVILEKFNFLDLNFLSNAMALKLTEDYLKIARPDQKMAIIINDASVLESELYKKSYLSAHVYDYYWYQVLNLSDTKLAIKSITENKLDINDIYRQTGGISRLIKFVCLKNGDVDINDLNLLSICRPMVEAINKASTTDLEKLGVIVNNQIGSEILRSMVIKNGGVVKISVDKDLILVEDGVRGNRVTRMERDLLKSMLENDNYLSRENVSEIKWGSTEYSDFSDQAINKTMRRLSEKMNKYTIETIWKTGFKLRKKE